MSAHKFSKSAQSKIEQAGGSCVVLSARPSKDAAQPGDGQVTTAAAPVPAEASAADAKVQEPTVSDDPAGSDEANTPSEAE